MAATAAALAGREFSVDVPFSVSEAGDDAELEWLAAFRENFQTPSNTARRPAVQEISNVPLQQSKKKRKQSTEPLVGVPGLMTSQARDVVTKVSTKTVRESFYLPPLPPGGLSEASSPEWQRQPPRTLAVSSPWTRQPW